MTERDIQQQVAEVLANVAPEVIPESLSADVPLRDQVDLDSMDFLRFVIELHKRFGLEIPEADYPRLATLRGVAQYVAAHAG